MAAFNLRIGQWLPHPKLARQRSHVTGAASKLRRALARLLQPEPISRRMEAHAGGRLRLSRLLWPRALLLRRCQLIIISDAGCNNGHFEFSALADVIRIVRVCHGIAIVDLDNECPANVAVLRREKNAQADPHHICLRA